MNTVVPVIYILVGIASILATGVNITNSTSDEHGSGGDKNATNTNSSSDSEEDKNGQIASGPKCLGSALCPD